MDHNLIDELVKSEIAGDCWIKIVDERHDSRGSSQKELKAFISDASPLTEYKDYLTYEENRLMSIIYPLNENKHSLVFVSKILDEHGDETYIAISGAFTPIMMKQLKLANINVSPLENLLKTIISFTKTQIKNNQN